MATDIPLTFTLRISVGDVWETWEAWCSSGRGPVNPISDSCGPQGDGHAAECGVLQQCWYSGMKRSDTQEIYKNHTRKSKSFITPLNE